MELFNENIPLYIIMILSKGYEQGEKKNVFVLHFPAYCTSQIFVIKLTTRKFHPTSNNMLKDVNKCFRLICSGYAKSSIKDSKQCRQGCSFLFLVHFEHIQFLILTSSTMTLTHFKLIFRLYTSW